MNKVVVISNILANLERLEGKRIPFHIRESAQDLNNFPMHVLLEIESQLATMSVSRFKGEIPILDFQTLESVLHTFRLVNQICLN